MYLKSTVAICDILGFSKALGKVPLNAIVDNGVGWLLKVLYWVTHEDPSLPDEVPSLQQLQSHDDIGVAVCSDTVLLYTRQNRDWCLQALLGCVARMLSVTMVPGPRLRCGIDYGDAYLDQGRSIFVGAAILGASALEKEQQWSGAALTQEAVQRVPESFRGGQIADWPVIPYAVPLKRRKSRETLAINWPLVGFHIPGGFELHWSTETAEPTPAEWIQEHDVCEKWWFTKKFHDEVCRCRPHGSLKKNHFA